MEIVPNEQPPTSAGAAEAPADAAAPAASPVAPPPKAASLAVQKAKGNKDKEKAISDQDRAKQFEIVVCPAAPPSDVQYPAARCPTTELQENSKRNLEYLLQYYLIYFFKSV